MMVAAFAPHAFNPAIERSQSGSVASLYFSLTTLTSTGYGDIAPVHPLARSLANLEAVVGELFPSILLARLVTQEIDARRRSASFTADRSRGANWSRR
jgi:voltage-gated potassium channel Kch